AYTIPLMKLALFLWNNDHIEGLIKQNNKEEEAQEAGVSVGFIIIGQRKGGKMVFFRAVFYNDIFQLGNAVFGQSALEETKPCAKLEETNINRQPMVEFSETFFSYHFTQRLSIYINTCHYKEDSFLLSFDDIGKPWIWKQNV
ncbi:hypothetical protein ACJX0J_027001, partial [Zea mays]